MGIVVRTPYVPGADITAEGQNANEDAIVNDHNGNIGNENVRALAGIEGSKLADAPSGITTAKINDLQVTTIKIADDAVDNTKLKDDAAIDINRAVTGNHIRDNAISTTKIANDAVTIGKLAVDVGVIAFTSLFPTMNAGEIQSINLDQGSGTGYTNSLVVNTQTDKRMLAAHVNFGGAPSGDIRGLVVTSQHDTTNNKLYMRFHNTGINAISGVEWTGVSVTFYILNGAA